MRTFLITGCSRSGTSLTAGLLHLNGICMGLQFTPNHVSNPLGFFEDLTFVNFNAEWLRNAGGSFASPPTQNNINRIAANMSAGHYIANQVATKGRAEWGLKDPRITWLWKFYAEAFKDCNPHLIITRRNFADTACSMVAAGWANDLYHGVKIAERFSCRLTQIVKQTDWPVLELHFEQWWDNRRRQEERLERFIERKMNFKHFVDK